MMGILRLAEASNVTQRALETRTLDETIVAGALKRLAKGKSNGPD